MPTDSRHQDAESRFRQLVDDAGLPAPDRVDYEPECLVFYWDESKAAVVVDLDAPDQSSAVAAR